MINKQIILVFQLIITTILISQTTSATPLPGDDPLDNNASDTQEKSDHLPLSLLLNKSGSAGSGTTQLPYKVSNYTRKQREPVFVGIYPPDASLFQEMLINESTLQRFKKETGMQMHPLLIFGPPGVGKTTLVHDIASHSKSKLYTLDYKMMPLKIQVQLLLKDLKVVAKKSLGGTEKKILFLKDLNPEIPMYELAEDDVYAEIFDRFFVIATSKIDLHDYDEMEAIENSQFFFKAPVEYPTGKNRTFILKNILKKRGQILSDREISTIVGEFVPFNGNHIINTLNKATKESIRKGRKLVHQDVVAAKKQRMTKGLSRVSSRMYL